VVEKSESRDIPVKEVEEEEEQSETREVTGQVTSDVEESGVTAPVAVVVTQEEVVTQEVVTQEEVVTPVAEPEEEEKEVAVTALPPTPTVRFEDRPKSAAAKSRRTTTASDTSELTDSSGSTDSGSDVSDTESNKTPRPGAESRIETTADVHHPSSGKEEESDTEATHGGADPDNVATQEESSVVGTQLEEVTPSQPHDGSVKDILEASQTTLEVKAISLTKSQVYEVADFLEASTSLRFVNLVNCGLDDNDVQLLVESLRRSQSNPVMLNLSMNPVTSGSVSFILETLKVKPSIEALVLQGSQLGDEGVAQIVEGLLYNHAEQKELSADGKVEKELQELDLSDCKFGDVGARAVAKLLTSDMDIDTLTLSHNTQVTRAGWSIIGSSLDKNETLQTLTLDHNNIGDEGLGYICSGLFDNTCVTALDLNHVGISRKGAESLDELMKRNTTLLEVTLAGNKLTSGQVESIHQYVTLNKTVNAADN